jgi:hypothetical protein
MLPFVCVSSEVTAVGGGAMKSYQGQCNKHGKAEARKRPIQLVMFLAPVIFTSEV